MSSIISEQKTKKTARRIIKIFISVIKVASNDGPCDVVEELRKAKRRFGGRERERERERKKMGLYGKKSATLCSNLRSPVCLSLAVAGGRGFVCSVIRVRALLSLFRSAFP